MPIKKNNENPQLLKRSSFLLFIFRNAYSFLSLNWIDRYIEQTVHTDFADGAKNITTKNMIKHANSVTLLKLLLTPPLREKCPYSELFWSSFSRIQTEYGEILLIFPYSVRMRENTNQNTSKQGHFCAVLNLLSTYKSFKMWFSTFNKKLCSCYCRMSIEIWEILSELFTFCNLSKRKIWKMRKIFANIARGNVR